MPGVKIYPKSIDPLSHLRFGTYSLDGSIRLGPGIEEVISDWQNTWGSIDTSLNGDSEVLRNAKLLFVSLLKQAKQSYSDDLKYEVTKDFKVFDEIEDTFSKLDDDSLYFVLTWPYFRQEVDNLVEALDENFQIYPYLADLKVSIDEALLAKENGLYIPGTSLFAVSNKANQVPFNRFRELGSSTRMLADSGYDITATKFLNLCEIDEDAHAIAWRRGLGLTDLNDPIVNHIVDNESVSSAHYIGHEEEHHNWDVYIPGGVLMDQDLTMEGFETALTGSSNVNEWVGEVFANARDSEIALMLRGNKPFNRNQFEHDVAEIDRVVSILRPYRNSISPQGLYILDFAEDLNRKNWHSVVRKPR